MLKVIPAFACSLFLCFCQKEPKGYIIEGNIQGLPDSSLIYLFDIELQANVDSTISIDESFVFRGQVESPMTYLIKTQGEYSLIQVENVSMTFEAPLKNMFLNSVIDGGREQELQNILNELQRPVDQVYYATFDSLLNRRYADENHKQDLISKNNQAATESSKILVEFAKKHANSYIGLDLLYRNRRSIPRDTLEDIIATLSSPFRSISSCQALTIYLEERTIELGTQFVDFEARTINDRPFKMSTLLGNYIYLTFWSAGCGPCRKENKFLSRHFNEIPEELKIVSFSIDRNPELWQKASTADEIKWFNVSDLSGGDGRVKTLYEVQAIPASFLIGKDGTVLDRFLGYDSDQNIIEILKSLIAKHETSN